MTWPLIDQYIQDFEQLAAEAGYTLGDAPTNRYFVRGLVNAKGLQNPEGMGQGYVRVRVRVQNSEPSTNPYP